jgi:hypothetical protein
MKNPRLEYAILFLKAFNKYLVICWSVFILAFAFYWFGFGNFIKRGPVIASAEGDDGWGVSSDWSGGVESDQVSEPQSIADQTPVDPGPKETDEVSAPEPTVQADVVVNEPAQSNEKGNYTSGRESDEVSAPLPLVDSSSPEVSVVNEPAPVPTSEPQPVYSTPTPAPSPSESPRQEVIREVVREVVRERDEDDDNDSDRRRSQATSTPTPTTTPSPSPSPSPSVVTTTAVVNGRTYTDVVRVARAGEPGAVCGGNATTVQTTRTTICDQPDVVQPSPRGEVLAAVATPTPSPSPSASPSLSPSPSPSASVQASPSPSPSVQPVRIVTANNALTIPTGQNGCPAGYTRTSENDAQIICQLSNTAQSQTQTQSSAKQIVLTGAAPTATPSGAPQVIAQSQTQAKELPNTGLPAAALGFSSLIPFGMGLKRWKINNKTGVSANSLWMERQLKS